MPHLVIEYFGVALEQREPLMQGALEVAVASGEIQRDNTKVRLVPSEAILMGDGSTSFIHVTLSLLAGRRPEAKLALAEALITKMRALCPEVDAISADIRDMDPACYKKSRRVASSG